MANPELARGDRAPNIGLNDHRGTSADLYSRAAGGPLVVVFLPSLDDPGSLAVLDELHDAWPDFAAAGSQLFCIASAPADAVAAQASLRQPEFMLIADPDGDAARAFGVANQTTVFVLDPRQRVLARLGRDDGGFMPRAVEAARQSPRAEPFLARAHPPVLRIPNVLDEKDCAGLLSTSLRADAEPAAVTTTPVRDMAQLKTVGETVGRRVFPEIRRAFQAVMSRVEGLWICTQVATPGPPFAPRRQNDSRLTRYRRFSMELELDGSGYDGGGICFPEYGGARYHLQTGEAIVYSSSLMSAALPIGRGSRHSLVSHFYDEEGERIRQEIRREAMTSGGAA